MSKVLIVFVLLAVVIGLLGTAKGCGQQRLEEEEKEEEEEVITDNYTIHMIDLGLGSGESMLIKTQSGKAILIDAGDERDLISGSNNYVANYLQSQGVTSLEAIILSHPHNDHTSMLDEVINAFPVKEFIYANYDGSLDSSSAGLYASLMALVNSKGIPTREVRSGQRLTYDNLTFSCYSPPATFFTEDTIPGYTAANNNSLVFRIANNSGVTILTTGDIELEAIDYLMSTCSAELSANIFKVPHSGSLTSLNEDFYAAISPEVSIISCPGYGDRPTQSVLDALEKISTVYRTDEDGHIIIEVEDSNYTVSTEK